MMRDLDLLPPLPHPAEHQTRTRLQFTNADRSHVYLHMVTNVTTISVITGAGDNCGHICDHMEVHMRAIGVRELKARASLVLRRVRERGGRGHASWASRRAPDPGDP